jgi:DNA-binding beta-propeller fold protein YncE
MNKDIFMNMKSVFMLISLLVSPLVFAIQPVTMSGPIPALSPTYSAGSSHTVIYTITNRVPKCLPITVEGISGSVRRIPVPNDCGAFLPPALGTIPSTCNLGISISPTQAGVGLPVNQILQVNYQGRRPLQALISFIPRQSVIYVSNFGSGNVSQCFVNLETGIISQCSVFSDPSFLGISDLTVSPSGKFVYVTNISNSTISECPVQANGMLSACTVSSDNGAFVGPSGITVNHAGTFFYATNFFDSTIAVCSINSTGRLGPCTQTIPGPLVQPNDIILNSQDTFAYIANNGANTVLRCPVEANGSLGLCTQSDPIFSSPTGITINSEGTKLYVNNAGTNTVSVCSILPGTNFLGSCISSNPGGTFNIAFGKNTLQSGSFLFVANAGGGVNTVSVCSLNSQGGLIACPTTNPNSTFSIPEGVALN